MMEPLSYEKVPEQLAKKIKQPTEETGQILRT